MDKKEVEREKLIKWRCPNCGGVNLHSEEMYSDEGAVITCEYCRTEFELAY